LGGWELSAAAGNETRIAVVDAAAAAAGAARFKRLEVEAAAVAAVTAFEADADAAALEPPESTHEPADESVDDDTATEAAATAPAGAVKFDTVGAKLRTEANASANAVSSSRAVASSAVSAASFCEVESPTVARPPAIPESVAEVAAAAISLSDWFG
jgi:hypothetical protein